MVQRSSWPALSVAKLRDRIKGVRTALVGRRLQLALIALPIVVLAIGVYVDRHLFDDGMIHMRVVQQIRAGNGPVLNLGERVEVSSSPLWVMLLAVLDLLLPFRLDLLALLAGGALTIVAFGAIGLDAFERGARSSRSLVVPASFLVLACSPGVWRWGTAGMEGGLTLAWVAALWVLARRADDRGAIDGWTILAVGLGPLVRQEFVVVSAAVLAGLLVPMLRRRQWRAVAKTTLAAAAPAVAYQVFRMAYYGLLVPNPTLAKNVGHSRFAVGWRWVLKSISGDYLWPAVVLVLGLTGAALVSGKASRRLNLSFVVAGLAVLAAPVAAGGDYLDVRLLLVPLFLVALPGMFVDLDLGQLRVMTAGVRQRFNQAALSLCVVAGATLILQFNAGKIDHHFAQLWADANSAQAQQRRFQLAPPGDGASRGVWSNGNRYRTTRDRPFVYVTALLGVGSVMQPPDVYVFDNLGLGHPLGSHFASDPGSNTKWIGHEKPMPASWVYALLRPDADPSLAPAIGYTPQQRSNSSFAQTPVAEVDRHVASAEHALTCPDIKDLLDAARAPLTLSRAWENFSGAFRRTALMIDADPTAYDGDCGR